MPAPENHEPTPAAGDDRAALAANDAREPTHAMEWLEDGQLEPLRALLEPALVDAMRRSSPDGRAHRTTNEHHEHRPHESATFTLDLDWFARPDATLDIDADDTAWCFDDQAADRFEQWNRMELRPTAGFAARRGDLMLHGGAVAPALGSPNVLIGGRPALRSCDTHVCMTTTPAPHASAAFVATHDRVRINGFPALRMGDYVDEAEHGLNPITTGCPTVVFGPVPKPLVCWRLDGIEPTPPPNRVPFRWHGNDGGRANGKLVLGVELSGSLTRVDGMANATNLWAERHPIPVAPQPLAPTAQHHHFDRP